MRCTNCRLAALLLAPRDRTVAGLGSKLASCAARRYAQQDLTHNPLWQRIDRLEVLHRRQRQLVTPPSSVTHRHHSRPLDHDAAASEWQLCARLAPVVGSSSRLPSALLARDALRTFVQHRAQSFKADTVHPLHQVLLRRADPRDHRQQQLP